MRDLAKEVPVGDAVGTCVGAEVVGGNVGGFVSPVLVGAGVGDAVGAAYLSMRYAALSVISLPRARRKPYSATKHDRPCRILDCGYVSLNRTRAWEGYSRWHYLRARVQQTDTLHHHKGQWLQGTEGPSVGTIGTARGEADPV